MVGTYNSKFKNIIYSIKYKMAAEELLSALRNVQEQWGLLSKEQDVSFINILY